MVFSRLLSLFLSLSHPVSLPVSISLCLFPCLSPCLSVMISHCLFPCLSPCLSVMNSNRLGGNLTPADYHRLPKHRKFNTNSHSSHSTILIQDSEKTLESCNCASVLPPCGQRHCCRLSPIRESSGASLADTHCLSHRVPYPVYRPNCIPGDCGDSGVAGNI